LVVAALGENPQPFSQLQCSRKSTGFCRLKRAPTAWIRLRSSDG
jgi:hypothetical protein